MLNIDVVWSSLNPNSSTKEGPGTVSEVCIAKHSQEKFMSRLVFLSVVAIIVILSCSEKVEAQRFRNRNTSDCGCQPNSQQSHQPSRANYRQRYQANYKPGYGAFGVRRNFVAAQRVPFDYQQNARLRFQPARQFQMRQQAPIRPKLQYSVARGCWVQAQNPSGQFQMQHGVLPNTRRPASQSNSTEAISQDTPIAPAIVAEPSEVQPATFETPMETSGLPLSAPQSIQSDDPIPEAEPAASSVLDNGN